MPNNTETVEYSPVLATVTSDEICDALRITRQTLSSWIARGHFPAPRRFGRRLLRWPAEVVNEWILGERIGR